MGKFAYALITVLIIEMSLFYFAGAQYSESTLFSLIKNPENITNNLLYLAILAAIGVFASAQIIPGNFFQINVYGVYAGIAATVLTFIVSVSHLFTFIYGEINGLVSPFDEIIAILITMPFIVFYTIATFEWVRGNQ